MELEESNTFFLGTVVRKVSLSVYQKGGGFTKSGGGTKHGQDIFIDSRL
jgi:hypothetical protein